MAAASELAHRKKLRREWKPACDLDNPDMVVAPTSRNLGTEKCISGAPSSAFADFLAEASFRPPAPVIFGNPINSLDYKRMAEVVDRIVESSETRKVIRIYAQYFDTVELHECHIRQNQQERSDQPHRHRQLVPFNLRMEAARVSMACRQTSGSVAPLSSS